MSIFKKPKIEHDPKKSVSTDVIKKETAKTYDVVVNRKYILEQLDIVIKEVTEVLEAFEGNALRYSISTTNSAVSSSVKAITPLRVSNTNINYAVYLKALSTDGADAALVASAYETKSIGLWGNYSVKSIKLLSSMKRELEVIKDFITKTEIEDSNVYPVIMQYINVARVSSMDVAKIPLLGNNIPTIKAELKDSSKEEIIGNQALLNEQISSIADSLERDESLLTSQVSSNSSYYYNNVAASAIKDNITTTESDGRFANFLTAFKSTFSNNSRVSTIDLEDRAAAFSEQVFNIVESITELATVQIYNQALVELGGAEEYDILDTYRDMPDEESIEAVTEEITGDTSIPISVSQVSQKALLDIRNQFTAIEDFEALKDNLYFPGTTKINGGNIETGTITAGAIQIGFKPLKTNIVFAAGILDAYDPSTGFDENLAFERCSHTAGYIETWNEEKEQTIYNLLESPVDGIPTDNAADIELDEIYYIYAQLNEADPSYNKIYLRNNSLTNPESDVPDEGFVIVNLGMFFAYANPRVVLSYGSTVINGNQLITGTVVADKLLIDNTLRDGDWLYGQITNAAGLAIEYSPNGYQTAPDSPIDWSSTFRLTDKYMRQSVDNGATWSASMLIVGEDGLDGQDGVDGTNGKSYLLTILGGNRTLVYNKDGGVPSPSSFGTFSVELREDGVVVTPASYTWTCSGSVISGAVSTASFAPTTAQTYDATTPNAVKVVVTYAGQTITSNLGLIITKIGATGSTGATGNYISHIFKNINSSTSYGIQPSGTLGQLSTPSGWSDSPLPLSAGYYTWMSKATKTYNGLLVTQWSEPVRLSGTQGEQGDPGTDAVTYKQDAVFDYNKAIGAPVPPIDIHIESGAPDSSTPPRAPRINDMWIATNYPYFVADENGNPVEEPGWRTFVCTQVSPSIVWTIADNLTLPGHASINGGLIEADSLHAKSIIAGTLTVDMIDTTGLTADYIEGGQLTGVTLYVDNNYPSNDERRLGASITPGMIAVTGMVGVSPIRMYGVVDLATGSWGKIDGQGQSHLKFYNDMTNGDVFGLRGESGGTIITPTDHDIDITTHTLDVTGRIKSSIEVKAPYVGTAAAGLKRVELNPTPKIDFIHNDNNTITGTIASAADGINISVGKLTAPTLASTTATVTNATVTNATITNATVTNLTAGSIKDVYGMNGQININVGPLAASGIFEANHYSGSLYIPFPAGKFTNAPYVVVSLHRSSPAGILLCVDNKDADGFDLKARSASSVTGVWFEWLAIGV